jgi:glycosyltransferase involved in cell wall biosynthesis
MYKGKKIGIAVPAHNEEGFILKTLSGIPDYVDRIYVCNDASIDKTQDKVLERMKNDDRIFLINHQKNTGVGGAIVDCHKKALEEGMSIVTVMAGDDQMDPAYLPSLLDPLIDGKAEYTKGNRLYSKEAASGMSKWRMTGNKVLTIMTKFVTGNWNVDDPQNGYTAITADALRKLPLDEMYKGYLFENDMLVKLNAYHQRIVDVPIPARYGSEKSGIRYYSFITKGLVFMMTSFLWRMNTKYLSRVHRPSRILAHVMMLAGFLWLTGLILWNYVSNYSIFDGIVAPLTIMLFGIALYSLMTFLKTLGSYGGKRTA